MVHLPENGGSGFEGVLRKMGAEHRANLVDDPSKPVDRDLLRKLSTGELDAATKEIVLTNIETIRQWSEAHGQILVEQALAEKGTDESEQN